MIDQTGTPTTLESLTRSPLERNVVVGKSEQSLYVTIPLSLLDTTVPHEGIVHVLMDLAQGRQVVVSRGLAMPLLDALRSMLKPMPSSGLDETDA